MFTRTLEIARGALAGVECMTLTLLHGLGMPADQLVRMTEAVEIARRELNALELEHWTCTKARGVH